MAKTTTIKLTQDPYIEGYDGAFLREISAEGKYLISGVWNNWYTASAEDAEGNVYTVHWALNDGFDPNTDEDASDAFEYEKPYMVIDDDGRNVVTRVAITY